MRTIICLAVVLWTAVAGAGPTALVLTDAGYQVMTVGDDGKAVLSPVTPVNQVVDLRTGKTPPGPVPPPDVTTDPIATQVRQWAAEVNDPTSAQALAIVYREVGKVSAGQSRDKVMGALRQATDSVLTSTGGTDRWKPWRGKVSALIDSEEAKGAVNYPKLCDSVANGLEASAPSPALDPALLQLIVSLILQIIQIFFGGGGTGV